MGDFEIQVPQDTEGEFEPQIVPKYAKTLSPSIQDAILSMYAKGMSTPDIKSYLKRIYGFEISAENPIEAFNRGIRKVTKTKTSFRTIDSLFKLLYLVSQDIEEKWTIPIKNWGLILNQLMVYFEGRI